MIFSTFNEFKKNSKKKNFSQIYAIKNKPKLQTIEKIIELVSLSKDSFIFESVEKVKIRGRYTIFGFNACIACLGCALWYTQVFKDWRSSMLKIQSSNLFCGICLEYIILRPVYYFHIYNSGLVLVNSQNNLEADS